MKVFVPSIATAAIAVCIGASGIARSQTTDYSSSQTTTTSPMESAAVAEKSTTVTAAVATSQTATGSSARIPSLHPLRGARPTGAGANMHQQQSTSDP